MASLRWGLATDPGRIRPENEDNALADRRAFIVADGMGGHRAGEVAAAIAVDLLRARLSEPGATLDDVVGAIAEANAEIYGAANDNPDQHGMGTTVTGLVLVDDASEATADSDRVPDAPPAEPGTDPVELTTTSTTTDDDSTDTDGDTDDDSTDTDGDTDGDGSDPVTTDEHDGTASWALINVGDSRTYLLRHGRLRRVTIDHSYVQELVATGHITDDEARTHPRRNIVTRALGIDPFVRVDAWTLPVVRDDRFLVCSDGLVDEVRDGDIAAVLTTIDDPQTAADELVALANRAGGRDNITVIVVDVVEGDDPPDPTSELDLEPAWDTGTATSSWAVDDPEGEATEFDDLAALVSGDDEGDGATPGGGIGDDTRRPITDEIPVTPLAAATPRRRRRVTGFLGGIALVAIVLLALVIAAAWARRGYFVAFDADDDVVIYRGRAEGFLWFDPTVDASADINRSQLDEASIERVERQSRFDSRRAAEEFVSGQLDTTTTTSTTTTSTTAPATTTTTTTPPTTVAP